MAEEPKQSVFRKSLQNAHEAIVSAAFPQLTEFLQGMRDDSEKDKEKSDAYKKANGEGSGEKILDAEINSLHQTLKATNIILTQSLEAQNKTNQILQNMVGSGSGLGGGGKNGLVDAVEDAAATKIVYDMVKGFISKGSNIVKGVVTGGAGIAALAGGAAFSLNAAEGSASGFINDHDMAHMGKRLKEAGKSEEDNQNNYETGDKYLDSEIKVQQESLDKDSSIVKSQENFIADLSKKIAEEKSEGIDDYELKKQLIDAQKVLTEADKNKNESLRILLELQKAKDNTPMPGNPTIKDIPATDKPKDLATPTAANPVNNPSTDQNPVQNNGNPFAGMTPQGSSYNSAMEADNQRDRQNRTNLANRIGGMGVKADTQEDKDFVKHSSAEAREAAEKYLGRKMSDDEYHNLIKATHAEASGGKIGNSKEQAMIMASILNRAKKLGDDGVNRALNAPNQFQSVTGTSKNNHEPSPNFVKGPNEQRQNAIESAAVENLASIPHNQTDFTAASSAAYGPGTNIAYRDKMVANGGKVYGGTVFQTSPDFNNNENVGTTKIPVKDSNGQIVEMDPNNMHGQAVAGGHTEKGIINLAQILKNDKNLPGGFQTVSAFNDDYHKGSSSKHAQGLATDFTLNDKNPETYKKANDYIDNFLSSKAGMKRNEDYWIEPQAQTFGSGSTGGHVHVQFQNKESANKFSEWAANDPEARKAINATPVNSIPQEQRYDPNSSNPLIANLGKKIQNDSASGKEISLIKPLAEGSADLNGDNFIPDKANMGATLHNESLDAIKSEKSSATINNAFMSKDSGPDHDRHRMDDDKKKDRKDTGPVSPPDDRLEKLFSGYGGNAKQLS